MKKLILPLMVLASFYSCKKTTVDDIVPVPPAAPLVITKADYSNYKVGGTAFSFSTVNAASVSVPASGVGQTWDFSTLTETGSITTGGANYLTPTNAAFSAATYMIAETNAWAVSGVSSPTFASNSFYELSDAGSYELSYSQNAAVSIVVASLGATITYPIQNLNYTGTTKYPNVIFPSKVGNAAVVTSGIVKTSSYTVTAAAFGLNNTPGQTKVTTTVTQEVLGSGTANFKNIGKVRVLVIKNSISDKTNYFLGGAPAPAALLTNLGLTDGEVTTSATYRFLGEGLGNVGILNANASGVITSAFFRK